MPPENRLHSTPGQTQPIRGTPPAFCGRLLKRFVSTPVSTHQRALPRADDCLGLLPASPRIRHHAAPIPPLDHGSSGGKRPHRSKALRAHETVDCRPPTADGGRRDGGQSAETPWTRRPRWRRRRTRRLSCPSPRRRKSKAHASGGRFPLFKPRDEAHRPRPAPENGRYV